MAVYTTDVLYATMREMITLSKEKKMKDVYRETLEREERIRALGFGFRSIFKHDFHKLCQTKQMKEFLSRSEITCSIDPRDAFFGGRVNGYKMIAKARPNEKILYYDFTSLYSFINKNRRIPTKHPKIIRENFEDIQNYFGLIKCRVLPPAEVYHPVLPVRLKGKLFFPLCKQCVLDACNKCCHSEFKRSFVGTFTTIEVVKAIEKGYRVLKIEEVWHFEESSDTLFTDYVNFFLKLKQESSGWPSWVKTPEDETKYIRDYFEHEGIQLRREYIKKNPGLRAVAKLCLNSLWGRFAMRTDHVITEFVNDPLSFYRLVNGADVELHDICLLTDDLVEVMYNRKHEFQVEHKATNIFIGIFTTAWARLELYNLLDLVGQNVLYCDTDSCIFLSKPGCALPKLGDYLGELTDEVVTDYGEGTFITDFVCTGPKCYAYKCNNGMQKCKLKGFTLNYKNSKALNFETMKDMICNLDSNKCIDIVNERKITREPHTRRILNKREKKAYSVVYDKRVIVSDGQDTIPFGYYWSPSNEKPNTPLTSTSSVPDHLLYTMIYPSAQNKVQLDDDLMHVDELSDTVVDLIDTDNEDDSSCPSENEQDLDFLNDEEMETEEPSFYQCLLNSFANF